ncbi:MAG TPA: c-type cytochrome domain-containing protein, partial [Luteitalea sp.]|nr:c-type cytochrome domain-containing protein [Luteitalea sp.]
MSAQARRGPVAPAPPDARPAHQPITARPVPTVPPVPAATFTEFCVDCHGKNRPKGGVSLTRLLERTTPEDVAGNWEHWLAAADRIEARHMPPEDADVFPSDAQRTEAVNWIRASLDAYDAKHAGEPG